MDQRITLITLGVEDLQAMTKWYEKVFQWERMSEDEGVSFFRLNGMILGLYPSNMLADDAGVQQDGSGFKRFSLAINFRSEAEVDIVFEALRKRGATILKPAEKAFWGGYSGYVSDPENNLWEIAYNPFWKFDE
ncbi:MAG: VOC family protein [Flavobacteriales bacterium]